MRTDERLESGRICNESMRDCRQLTRITEGLWSAKVGNTHAQLALLRIAGVEKGFLAASSEPLKLEPLVGALVGGLLALLGAFSTKMVDQRFAKRQQRTANASRFVGVCVAIIDEIDKSGTEFEALIKETHQLEPDTYAELVRQIRRICEYFKANQSTAEDAIREIKEVMLGVSQPSGRSLRR